MSFYGREAIKKMGLSHDAAPTFKSGVPHGSTGNMLRCSIRIRRGNLIDSIAVVADGGGNDGFRTGSGFRKESALIVP